jgi:superfamily II DNA or RNA helicase
MTILTINNSYSRITNMSPSQEKQLRAALSYSVETSYFKVNYGPKKRCLIDKKGNFPTGLINRIPFSTQIIDNRRQPISRDCYINLKDSVYEWQRESVNTASFSNRGIISAPTGTGKSLVIKLLAARLNVKTLIVVPSLEIKKQLQETLKDLQNVTIENIDSKTLQTAKDYDCLIIDEAHHVAAKTYQKLNKTAWVGIYYRFFFTATPFRNNADETMLFEAIAGRLIYKLDYETAIRKGYIAPIEAFYLEIPKQDTDAFTYSQVYSQLVVNNEVRNLTISKMLLNLQQAGISTLCLVKEVAHGRLLADLTGLPFVSGADDESRQYIQQLNSGELKVLIGTTGILGEGVDTKPCEYVIIAGLGKAKSQFMQQIGRAVRRYPGKGSAKIILIQDKSHKFLIRHFNVQRAILKQEYGVTATKLEVL